MIRAGIIGATGYAGGELVRLLAGHKEVEVVWFGSRSYQEIPYTNVYQNLFQIVEGTCGEKVMEALADDVDVIFTATPQGFCAGQISESGLPWLHQAPDGPCQPSPEPQQHRLNTWQVPSLHLADPAALRESLPWRHQPSSDSERLALSMP